MAGQRCLRRTMVLLVAMALLLALTGGAAAQDDVPVPTVPAMQQPGHDHAHGDDGEQPTAGEQAAADQLVTATKAGVDRFADIAAAEAAGYRIVTPFAFYGARAAHFHNDAYALDGRVLDPERPEDLVYLKQDDGQLVLLGVMYLAPVGEGPAVGGPLTQWHTHDDLCGSADGLVPSLPSGECPPGTGPLGVEMLHVWLVDHPEGPFADAPPPSAVTVPAGPLAVGGSLVAGASLVDSAALTEAVATVLGLPPIEVGRRFVDGESLAEMATGQHVPRQALEQVIIDRLSADYDRAVAAGDMTPAQRDLLRQTLPTMFDRMVEIHAGEPWLVAAGAG
jgi:hypothetical protein